MPEPALVSIVLSFRNEAASIPELLDRLTRTLSQAAVRYELIFVDDASTDESLALLTARAAADPHVKIATMARRFGPSECAIAGLALAGGSAVILMDADLQDPPELIPTLLDRWREGADVVYTVRTARHGEPLVKRLLTRTAYRVVRLVASIDLPIEAGDFRLLSRRVVDELLRLPERTPYLRGLVAWVGFRQVPVYYERQPRHGGRTHFPLLGTGPGRMFLAGVTSFSTAPLVIVLVGGLAVCGGTLAAAGVIAMRALSGAHVPAWSWIVLGFGMLGGLQLVGLGTIAVYLGRVYENVQGRPRYIVDRTTGFETSDPMRGPHHDGR
jgi:glycosyltransferase involved in cell wall biosynthesis